MRMYTVSIVKMVERLGLAQLKQLVASRLVHSCDNVTQCTKQYASFLKDLSLGYIFLSTLPVMLKRFIVLRTVDVSTPRLTAAKYLSLMYDYPPEVTAVSAASTRLVRCHILKF